MFLKLGVGGLGCVKSGDSPLWWFCGGGGGVFFMCFFLLFDLGGVYYC